MTSSKCYSMCFFESQSVLYSYPCRVKKVLLSKTDGEDSILNDIFLLGPGIFGKVGSWDSALTIFSSRWLDIAVDDLFPTSQVFVEYCC